MGKKHRQKMVQKENEATVETDDVKGKDTDNDNGKEDLDVESRCIFIRNLPYSINDEELQEVFSEIGPVRRSFTIKEKGAEQHRGFGFVHFAVAEDAIRAVQEKNGTDIQGRKIMVTPAKRRIPLKHRSSKKQSSLDNGEGNLESANTKEALGIPTKKKNENNAELNDKKAISPVSSVKEKRKHDGSEASGERIKRNKDNITGENKSSEKQRVARTVIIGGLLSPDMREQVLECAKKVGPVESMQSSLAAQELKGRGLEKDGCKMGAASIIYTSVRSASQAVCTLHGKVIGGGTIWARQLGGEGSKPKQWTVIIRNLPFKITEDKLREIFSSVGFLWEVRIPRKEDGQAKGFAFASFTSKANAEKAIQTMNGQKVEKRPIAVDWSVERKVYQENANIKVNPEADSEKLPSDLEDEETASEDDEDYDLELQKHTKDFEENEYSDNEDIDLTQKVLKKVVSASQVKEQENISSKSSVQENKKDTIPKVENKPLTGDKNTTAEIDKELSVGDKSVKSTSDENLNRTVFISNLPFNIDADVMKKHFLEFGKVESVFLVLHPKTKRPKGSAFVKFSTAEGAKAALDAASTGLVLGGRLVKVLNALEKGTAKAKEKENLESAVTDRRNLYLVKEGKIEGTAAAEGVSEEDMQKRRELEQVKAVKLRSPNFHVSKTRLAVYNIPKSMKKADIEKLFVDAVKSRATKQIPVIKEVMILKDEEKGGAFRGVAFVEFSEHEHALVALRALNNNPETFGRERRPIVGFAIENIQKVRQRQHKQAGHDDKKRTVGSQTKEQKSFKVNNGINQEEADKAVQHDPAREISKLHGKKRKKSSERRSSDPGEANEESVSSPKFSSKKQRKPKKGFESDNNVNSPNKPAPQTKMKTNPAPETKMKTKQNKQVHQSTNGHPTASMHVEDSVEPKARNKAKNKKNRKPEIEDRLDKLVAQYRNKYFSNGTTTAKENQSITNGKPSTDLKRWFD